MLICYTLDILLSIICVAYPAVELQFLIRLAHLMYLLLSMHPHQGTLALLSRSSSYSKITYLFYLSTHLHSYHLYTQILIHLSITMSTNHHAISWVWRINMNCLRLSSVRCRMIYCLHGSMRNILYFCFITRFNMECLFLPILLEHRLSYMIFGTNSFISLFLLKCCGCPYHL
jgi:hypothetical protein